MQIIVVSDNHGDKNILEEVIKANPKADIFIHCGDSEMYDFELSPFMSVKGNNDYYIDNEYRIVHSGFFNAYITHGHKVYLSKDNMVSKARANDCNFFIFGHIHRPYFQVSDNVYLLCPGSLSYPRSEEGLTYARINIEANDVKVEFVKI